MLDYGRALQVQTDGQLLRVYSLRLVIVAKLEGQEEYVALPLGEPVQKGVGGEISVRRREHFVLYPPGFDLSKYFPHVNLAAHECRPQPAFLVIERPKEVASPAHHVIVSVKEPGRQRPSHEDYQ